MSKSYETILAELSSSDPDDRRLAVYASVRFGDKMEIVDKLIELLSDEDIGVRDAVANAIISIFGEFDNSRRKIVKGLCDLLCCGDIGLKNLSAEILVKIGKDAVDELIKLSNHSDKDVRKMAIDTLGLIRERSVVPFLKEKLNDQDPNVVVSVIEAIGNIGDDGAVGALIDSFAKFEFAQIPIIEALGKIGEKSPNKNLILDFLIEVFGTADDPILKSAVVESIGKVGDERNLDFLMRLTFDKNRAIQKMAVVSIVEICARTNCDFKANKHFFKFFFKRAKEIFYETEDIEFKACFLDFVAKLINYDDVKIFLLELLKGSDEISTKAFDIIVSNAGDFLKFCLGNQISLEDFVDLVELVFYNSSTISNDVELKRKIVEKLSVDFELLDSERKVAVLNLLRLLDRVSFDEILRKIELDSDPIVKAYIDSNLS
jgi:HEAT repeat protein